MLVVAPPVVVVAAVGVGLIDADDDAICGGGVGFLPPLPLVGVWSSLAGGTLDWVGVGTRDTVGVVVGGGVPF
jgi:hypothetical protein